MARRSLKVRRPIGNATCRYEPLSYDTTSNHWENVSSGASTGYLTSTVTTWPDFQGDATKNAEVASNAELAALASCTVSSWIKPAVFAGTTRLVSPVKPAQLSAVWTNTSGYLGWYDYGHTPPGAGSNVNTTTQLSLDTWYHVAFAMTNGSPGSAVLYVNGAAVHTGHYTCGANTAAALMVGAMGMWPFDGLMDTVRIYNRVLSTDEILRNYHSGMAGHQ